MTVEVRKVGGAALKGLLEEVAALRIAVFRDWPYLYDGCMDYERRYLTPYVTSENAVVVGAFDGQRLIGASTGAPLADHAEDFGDALRDAGHDIASTFYCAESVLLPTYRGQGVGHAFFDHREAHARDLGFSHSCFCSVIRPADHPARPDAYRPLDSFWTARGYRPLAGVNARFAWRDVGSAEESAKTLRVWMRHL
jgi:GNAT superfamily N-acetyltransferase